MHTTEQSDRVPAESFLPGEILADELEARGWSQSDLAEILGRPVRLVNELVLGKRSITPETANGLAQAFGTSAELWMNLESAYQLSRVRPQTDAVARRSKLYSYAPIKEMIRRGWIESSTNIETLEQQVKAFFDVKSFDDKPTLCVAARAKRDTSSEWTPAQVAWFCRARHLAKAVSAKAFSPGRLEEAVAALSRLWNAPESIREAPKILAEYGIRLVIVEDLPGTKIDGACIWLSKSSPVIALSLRIDWMDSVWYTLMHELGHVRQGYIEFGLLDVDIFSRAISDDAAVAALEADADAFASEALIPAAEFDDFMARTRPLYSRTKIEAFAASMSVHPGFVLGRLQKRKIIPWRNLLPLHPKVRQTIIPAALSDGYGQSPPVPLG